MFGIYIRVPLFWMPYTFLACLAASFCFEAAAPATTAAPSTETASSKPRKQRRGKRRTEREQAANQECLETNEDDLEPAAKLSILMLWYVV